MGKNALRILVITMVFIILAPQTGHAENNYDYVLEKETRVPIPRTYQVTRVISYLGDECGYLKGAEDIFIDDKGLLYVADTGNNRILKLNSQGTVLKVFTGAADKPLAAPRGVYVDKDGDIYIADTGNARILHTDPDGGFVEEFTRPESELLQETVSFDPSKVYVSSTGYLYIIKGKQFMTIDAHNRFRGYVGAEHVGFRFSELLVRIFASEEQKSKLKKRQPPPYVNFVIHEDGMIYGILDSPTDQIRKLNSVGKNIYKEDTYGELNEGEPPSFADIAVDKNGIISVLEWKQGRIYQYDQDGNLLTVFGGTGNVRGMFESPSSLAVDREGCIYVLDRGRNNIQVFKPTNFIKDVHEAVKLYADGKYDESMAKWRDVLRTDANYTLAHKGIAKALFKDGRYEESMAEYVLADDPAGYSESFGEYRHELFRGNFGWLILIVITAAYCLLKLFMVLKAMSRAEQRKDTVWQGEV